MIRSHTTTQLIAKEGWKCVSVYFILFLLSLYFDFFQWVFLFLLLVTVYIFRNPERIPSEDDNMALLAPADGKISDISKVIVRDGTEFLKLEIRKSLFDVSLIRSPLAANITKTKKIHGLFLEIEDNLSKKLNEKAILTLKSDLKSMVVIITAGFFSRGIELFKSVGPLKFAQRFAILFDGSIELLLPMDMRIKVNLGDRVKAGESVLGYFSYNVADDEQK